MFYWMRIFPTTALIVNLLQKTFEGIVAFTMVLFVAIAGFSNVLYVYNRARLDGIGGEIAGERIF